jgi:hypothetical protein
MKAQACVPLQALLYIWGAKVDATMHVVLFSSGSMFDTAMCGLAIGSRVIVSSIVLVFHVLCGL